MIESTPNTERALMDTRLLQAYFQIEYPDALLLMGRHLGEGMSNNVAFHYKDNEAAWKKDQLRMKQHIEHQGLSKNIAKGLYIFPKKTLGYHFVLHDGEILKSFLNLAKKQLEMALSKPKIIFILSIGQKTRREFSIYTSFFHHKFYDKNILNLIMAFIFQNETKEKLLLNSIMPVNPLNRHCFASKDAT